MQALMDQAETLFAANGLGHVSVREIVLASGQRNTSVATYHFGSREALLVAVVERRRRVLNDRRNQYLDALVASGQADDIRQLMGVAVRPLADFIQSTDWGAKYVQIASEFAQRPQARQEGDWNPSYLNAMDRIDALVRGLLPEVPPSELTRRLRMIREHVTCTLSAWTRKHGSVTSANRLAFRREVETLIDFIAGGVTAPARPARRRSVGAGASASATAPIGERPPAATRPRRLVPRSKPLVDGNRPRN